MNGKTHAAVGMCAAAFILVPKVDLKTSLIGLGICAIGSYATDADIKTSKAGHVVSDLIFAVITLMLLYFLLKYNLHYDIQDILKKDMPGKLKNVGIVLVIGSIILGRITGHRKYMHSLLGFLVMSLGAYLIVDKYVVWFSLGYALHILLDLVNEKPESLLFPLPVGQVCFYIVKDRRSINYILSSVAYLIFIYKMDKLINIGYFHSISLFINRLL